MAEPLDALALTPHALRSRILAELHARPFSPLPTPCRLLRFAFMANADAAQAAMVALAELAEAGSAPLPEPDARHFTLALDGARLRFERHNEFLSYTWTLPSGQRAFTPSGRDIGAPMKLLPQPGPLIAAIDLQVLAAADAADTTAAFAGPLVAMSDVEDGRARVVTDFKVDPDGFVRILIEDRSLSPASTGALAQRLLEIETYRTLALLGLPQAQLLAPLLDRVGSDLSTLMREVQAQHGFEANRTLLDRLTALAAEVERHAADSTFRFGATRAYEELIQSRLESIREQPALHHSSLGAFLSRRLTPAIRTCTSVEARQADLSLKLARFADLLRTRVDIELESQNALQLRQMSERMRLQLRLQQTVEGLSVAAITYYVASVAHIVFEGLHAGGAHLDPQIATAGVVPIIAIVVGAIIWRIRYKHPAD